MTDKLQEGGKGQGWLIGLWLDDRKIHCEKGTCLKFKFDQVNFEMPGRFLDWDVH